jgi:hypothetical protein
MNRANAIGPLGMLAVGLGIGAAVVATSGIAAADSAMVDPAAFDPSVLVADPAPAASGLDLAISIDGHTLFQEGTATAYSGTDDIAIAYGDGSSAEAGDTLSPGIGDFAVADGTGSYANSGIGDYDSASAIGSDSEAIAGAGNGDSAYADGTGTAAIAGGEFTSGTPNTLDVAGSDMYAAAVGNNDFAQAGSDVDGSASTTAVTGDIATVIGNSSEAYAGAGNYDFAGVLGEALTSHAIGANLLFELMPSL